MKVRQYFLSYFVSAEKKTKEKFYDDLKDLLAKVISMKDCGDTYETTRVLLYAVDDKLDLFEEIKKNFESVNYGQHKFVIASVENIIKALRYLNRIYYIANVCKIHKSEPLLSYVYVSVKGRVMQDLATLKREDELTWTGDLESLGNGPKLKKISTELIQVINPNLRTLITYIEN